MTGLPADMDHASLQAKSIQTFSNIGCKIHQKMYQSMPSYW